MMTVPMPSWKLLCLVLGTSVFACTSPDDGTPDDTAVDSDTDTDTDADSDTDADADADADADTDTTTSRRVPAEWEPHAATWIQWPGRWETQMRPAFAEIVDLIQDYEAVELISSTEQEVADAQQYLAARGVPTTNLTWHVIPIDNAWMRDNGPVYVEVGAEIRALDFRFDAWGGNFGGHVTYQADNEVPAAVADILDIPLEDHQDYVLERGNLEFNGAGILVINWDCQDDRNPGMTELQHEAILTEAFGLERVIWAYGHDRSDGTTGHIDGYARFIDADTIAIGDTNWGEETEEPLAMACEEAGLEVVRIPGPRGTDYMNWLEGNGFVAAMSFDDQEADADALAVLETLFPDRDVHMLDASTLWDSGGGIHCVTNDQPLLP